MVPRLPDNLQEESRFVSGKTENGMPDGGPLPKGSSRAGILVLSFLTVYILWGGTFFAMRVGVESFPPLILAGMRHLSVGVVLYPLLRWRTGIRPTAQQWRTAAITGVLLLCIGNGGVCWAEQTVPSGIAALLVATVTLWMVIVDWVRPGGHKPSARILFGIVMGFAGMAILVGPARLGHAGRVDPVGAAILIVASLAWACGSLYSKHGTLPSSPMLGVAMQGLCGGAALWLGGAFSPDDRLVAVVGGGWVSVSVRVVHRIYSIPLYLEEKHCCARRDVRVCESDCGAGDWTAAGRRSAVAEDAAGCGGDSDSRSRGNHGTAS